MAKNLTRRGMFLAFAPRAPERDVARLLAHVSVACLELKAIACQRCREVCDAEAISYAAIGAGRAATRIDDTACVGCAACVSVCPVSAIDMVSRERSAFASELAGLAHSTRASR